MLRHVLAFASLNIYLLGPLIHQWCLTPAKEGVVLTICLHGLTVPKSFSKFHLLLLANRLHSTIRLRFASGVALGLFNIYQLCFPLTLHDFIALPHSDPKFALLDLILKSLN